jgi:3-phosphoshikimate 1-carboxyvinyltransferase
LYFVVQILKMIYRLSKKDKNVKGVIELESSKSISNRVLIINKLCKDSFEIKRLSGAKDTQTLLRLLSQKESTFDAGHAGTTFRFMTAFLATQNGTQIMTGSERMQQRPIADLVSALNLLGADIQYLKNEGYPPLQINAPKAFGENNKLTISASVSSQFITALLLIAPTLPKGLILTLEGNVVSRSYIEMTLVLMQNFGVSHTWEGDTISILPQEYQAKNFIVESDWSAASYYFSVAAFADDLELQLIGLQENSLQGDSAIVGMMQQFGVQTTFTETGLILTKKGEKTTMFEQDFLLCPDIAQTLAVACAGTGITGLFSGLETLRVKETDRILALKNELSKVNTRFYALPKRFSQKTNVEYFMTEEKANWSGTPIFATYEDHRMAMSFAPLAMFAPIKIEHPNVVEKSYPTFWEDLKKLGFEYLQEPN